MGKHSPSPARERYIAAKGEARATFRSLRTQMTARAMGAYLRTMLRIDRLSQAQRDAINEELASDRYKRDV